MNQNIYIKQIITYQIIRKMFSNKFIGQKFIWKKFYSVKPSNLNTYKNFDPYKNCVIIHRYTRDYTHTNMNLAPDNALRDMIVSLHNDIKTLRMDMITLHSRINNLTNKVEQNHLEVNDALYEFTCEIKKILGDFSNEKNK